MWSKISEKSLTKSPRFHHFATPTWGGAAKALAWDHNHWWCFGGKRRWLISNDFQDLRQAAVMKLRTFLQSSSAMAFLGRHCGRVVLCMICQWTSKGEGFIYQTWMLQDLHTFFQQCRKIKTVFSSCTYLCRCGLGNLGLSWRGRCGILALAILLLSQDTDLCIIVQIHDDIFTLSGWHL